MADISIISNLISAENVDLVNFNCKECGPDNLAFKELLISKDGSLSIIVQCTRCVTDYISSAVLDITDRVVSTKVLRITQRGEIKDV